MPKKELWKDLKYWQKGGLIGVLLSLFVHFALKISNESYGFVLGALGVANLQFDWSQYTLFPAVLAGEPFGKITVLTFLIITIWYCLLGSLSGLTFKAIHNKIKSTREFAFLLYVFIFLLILVPLLNLLFTLLFILPRLGFG